MTWSVQCGHGRTVRARAIPRCFVQRGRWGWGRGFGEALAQIGPAFVDLVALGAVFGAHLGRVRNEDFDGRPAEEGVQGRLDPRGIGKADTQDPLGCALNQEQGKGTKRA